MSLIDKTQSFFQAHFQTNDCFILGISGGMDSIVLAEVLIQCNIHFIAAHVNYQLRGEESKEDQLFVERWAKEKNIPLELKIVEKENNHVNTQQWARDIRRVFMKECLIKHNAKSIILAHHLDDQLESQMLQFLRGSIQGMGGMKIKNDIFARPFLFVEKKEIIEFAQSNNLSWRDDSSNAKTLYKRNFLRHSILPLLKENFHLNAKHIQHHSNRLNAHINWHHELLQAWLDNSLIISHPTKVVLEFQTIPSHLDATHVLFHWLHPYGFSAEEMDEILELKYSENGSFRESKDYKIYKTDSGWNLIEKKHYEENIITIESNQSDFIWNHEVYSIKRKKIDDPLAIDKNTPGLLLDAETFTFPIQIRSPKTGDRFQPLGMKGTTLLSDFFTQKKIASHQKTQSGVICSQDQIIGILDHRISDKAKVTEHTKEIIQIQKIHLHSIY